MSIPVPTANMELTSSSLQGHYCLYWAIGYFSYLVDKTLLPGEWLLVLLGLVMVDRLDARHAWYMDRLSHTTGRAYSRLREWQQEGRIGLPFGTRQVFPFPDELDEFLAHLCGYNDVHDMAYNYRPETSRILELLVGEHGWVIFKMLEARNGR